MGSKNSKLDGEATGVFKGWMAARAVFLSHRRQTQPSADIIENVVQILPTLKNSDTHLLDDKDDNVNKHEEIVADKIRSVDKQLEEGEREGEGEEVEEGYERRDMIMLRSHSSSPSFRVYCLDACQSDYDDEVDNDHDCSTDLVKATTVLTQQSSQNSNDEEPVKIPKRRWKRRRFGVGRSFLNLKIPLPRRSISTGSIVDKSDRRQHFQMPRISNFRSIGGIMNRNNRQHPTVNQGGYRHHRDQQQHHKNQLSLQEPAPHQSITDCKNNDHHNHQDLHSSQGNLANDNNHSHDDNHLMKSPRISHRTNNGDDYNGCDTSNTSDSQRDCKSHGDDIEDNNSNTRNVGDNNTRDQDQQQQQQDNQHQKNGVSSMSFWNKARRQVRGGRTTHHG